MCQPDMSYLLKQGKTLTYMVLGFFFAKIREIYYHCCYQSVCECRNVHYLYSNVSASGNLPYIAPAEQTFLSPKELREVQYRTKQCRKNTILAK